MKAGTRARRATIATVGLATAAALTLTACTGQPAATEESGVAGGDLVVGFTAEPDNLFPWTATQFQSANVLQNLYSTLTEYDEDLNVTPGLAESWEVSEDGLTVTFTLRDGVTFTDGSALDSADVKYSLDAIKDEATAAVSRATLTNVASVEATDPTTVTLTMSAPDAALPSNLATINMAILSSDDTAEALATEPNGSGPFKFDKRVPNQSITLTRNDDYWGDEALVDSVEFRIIPDETSIVSAMQSGNVQLAVLSDPVVAQTAETGTTTVERTPQLSYHTLQLNASRGDLADVNVRLAIQCAIDRQEVLDTAALGEGEVTGPFTSPAFRSDPEARPCPKRDLDKAAEYLDKAGKSSVTLNAIVNQGGYATSVAEAQNLAAQLAEANITLNLEVLESGAYVDRWVAGDFDTAVALNGGRPDPDGAYSRYFTSTGNLNKVAAYSTPELDALFEEGRATADQSEREAIYTQISDNLENNAPWIWLFTGFNYTAMNGVTGFVPLANGSLQNLRTASLTQ